MSEDSKQPPGKRFSDIPVDLAREREDFVRTFMREGVELTEELLDEMARLRIEVVGLRRDNALLRAQVKSDEAIRELLGKIEGLEREKQNLLVHSTELEAVRRRDETRYEDIEREFNDLATLYIASTQLHGLSPRRVVRHVKDILGQLVGAEMFALFVVAGGGKRLEPVGAEGIELSSLASIAVGEGPIGEVALTGVTVMRDDLRTGALENPVAIVPVVLGGKITGVIAVATVLPHKRGWATIDRELFKLLTQQAGLALTAANLYAAFEGGPTGALSTLKDHLARPGTSDTPVSRT